MVKLTYFSFIYYTFFYLCVYFYFYLFKKIYKIIIYIKKKKKKDQSVILFQNLKLVLNQSLKLMILALIIKRINIKILIERIHLREPLGY